MRFWAVRHGQSLVPHGDESIVEFERLPFDRPLQIEAKQPRNPRFHRLFWALCARIGHGIGKEAEWVERAFKTEQGLFDVFLYTGKEHFVLRSIAFGEMEETEFRAFFEGCVTTAYNTWGVDPASVADLLVKNEDQKR